MKNIMENKENGKDGINVQGGIERWSSTGKFSMLSVVQWNLEIFQN